MMNDIINIIKDKINDFKAKYDTNPDYVIIGVYDFLKIINDINNLEQDVITVQPIIGNFRIFGIDVVIESNRNSGDIYIAGSPKIEIEKLKQQLNYGIYINKREYEKLMGIYRYIVAALTSNQSEFLGNMLQIYNKKIESLKYNIDDMSEKLIFIMEVQRNYKIIRCLRQQKKI